MRGYKNRFAILGEPSDEEEDTTESGLEDETFTEEETSDTMEEEIVTLPENINYTRQKLQHEYKHAEDFGIKGNPNKENLQKYQEAIQKHIDTAPIIYLSRYKGEQVFVYINPATSIGAYVDMDGNYIGGWKFNDRQMQYHAKYGRRIR